MTIIFPKQEGGFEPVTYAKFKEFKNNPNQFFVNVAVAKWEDNRVTGKARYAYSRWADLLQCCEKTAIKYINKACDDKVIYKKEGKLIVVNRQETNTYSIFPFPADEQVEETTPQVELEVDEEVRVIQETVVKEPVEEVKPERFIPEYPDEFTRDFMNDYLSQFKPLDFINKSNPEQ